MSLASVYSETLCFLLAILNGTEPDSALTHALFILLCSPYFFFLGYSQWLSCADRGSTLKINIRLPLFWSTRNRAEGQNSATCAGLAHAHD